LELLVRARILGGKRDEAEQALEVLRQIERRVGTAPIAAFGDHLGGLLAAAASDHVRARELLEDALDCFDQSGAPFEASVTRIELAASLFALKDAEGARREIDLAQTSLRDLGATAEAERAGLLLSKAAGEGGSAVAPLTRRECQVLGLLADGLTNRQIGEHLRLSEHTVHRHVTNILCKLDLPSRAAAAAWAVRSGLIHPRDA
jgi:DNA-binding NarL/FixJ family response regulator